MLEEVLKSIDCVLLFCSFSGNSFILFMNALVWVRNKSLNVSDQLTSGICLSEALYEVLKACGFIFQMPEVNIGADPRVSLVVALTILSCRFWLSTWLCVNFCLKIVNFNKEFYIYLQKTFSENVLWLLVLCLLGSSLLSWAVGFGVPVQPFLNSSLGVFDGNASSSHGLGLECPLVCQAFIYESLLGFLLSSASLVAIITSLYSHMKNMQSMVGEFRSPNIDVHLRAVRTISFLLLGNLLASSS
ncbi:taste receptor type 2 member 105-like [Rana temporaria]|uniref:taste receptor type 2 member 105-like n=1 Tax=Rana temporaria TaxID=8407 RepID=UPI001AAD5C92|nr:taste receptor type 2 member 105-like [Rana temporaria]